jgi:glycosyltransferase involved in cell wall biosynthesis
VPSTLIVVPCYNEAARLDAESFVEFLAAEDDFSLVFVNDGSTDDTRSTLESIRQGNPQRVFVYEMPHNSGKAEAVRQGILQYVHNTEFEYFGFIDADLAAPLSQLPLLQEYIRRSQAKFAIGSRVKRLGAEIRRSTKRHYVGRVFATVVSSLFAIEVYDSQCGLKLIHRDLTQIAFAEPFQTRWIFDVEILLRLRDITDKYAKWVVEVPLNHWAEQGGSKITVAAMVMVPRDLIRLRRHYRRGRG